MTTITATDLKQNTMRLQEALRGDLLVTKRDKPFVVVMDYEKYRQLEEYIRDLHAEQANRPNDGYPTISLQEANDRVAEAVTEYRHNGLKNTRPLNAEFWDSFDETIMRAGKAQ